MGDAPGTADPGVHHALGGHARGARLRVVTARSRRAASPTQRRAVTAAAGSRLGAATAVGQRADDRAAHLDERREGVMPQLAKVY